LSEIRRHQVRACVALNPATPAEAIRPVLSLVDQVLVMTVNPGFGGQAFIAETLPKIRQIRGWIDELRKPIDLVVDGGVSPDTIEAVALHGARVFVMGNAFFKSGDYKRFADKIRGQLASLSGPVPT
jgi:ribulose-phosphate 3-epimerase